jgi:hypothetical protein
MDQRSLRMRQERAKKLAVRLNTNMWGIAVASLIIVFLVAWFLFAMLSIACAADTLKSGSFVLDG